MMSMKRSSIPALLLFVALAAGCAAPPAGAPASTPTMPAAAADATPTAASPAVSEPMATSEPPTTVEPTATVELTATTEPAATVELTATIEPATPDVTALCPDETEGTALYVNAANGLCFLYPSAMEMVTDVQRPQDVVTFMGSVLDPQAMESIRTLLSVSYNGPADVANSAGYAAKWNSFNVGPMDLVTETATIGEAEAQIVRNIPGMANQRSAFVVANGQKYRITLQPQPEDVPDLAEEAVQAWDTVTQSIVFFPPQEPREVVRAEDVCPEATAGADLFVSEQNGYCMLYPDDFELDPEFDERIIGGPELGPVEGFDSVRTSIVAGTYYVGTLTPEEVLRPASEQVDTSSVQTTTIGGYPAVVFDFTGGPWRQRTAQILAGYSVYTLVGQPWDPEMFPQTVADMERLWNQVTESIQFFDKWH